MLSAARSACARGPAGAASRSSRGFLAAAAASSAGNGVWAASGSVAVPSVTSAVSAAAASAAAASVVSACAAVRTYAAEPKPASAKRLSESQLSGTSASYIDNLYASYTADPKSVAPSWARFFKAVDAGAEAGNTGVALPPIFRNSGGSSSEDVEELRMITRVMGLIRAYQVRGHEMAKLDPLGLQSVDVPPEIELKSYGFSEADLSKPLQPFALPGMSTHLMKGVQTLGDLVARLQKIYCGTTGYEYMHIASREKCDFLRNIIEDPEGRAFDRDARVHLLDRLMWSQLFEQFLQTKFPTAKRFGLEGCESLIPGLKHLIDSSAVNGVDSIVMGMPHRGRLNVLCNVVRKPLEAVFKEFSPPAVDRDLEYYEGSGDVKYHLGTSFKRPVRGTDNEMSISLCANPSHLEAVNAVVFGSVRAKHHDSKNPQSALGVVLHGDAAFAGQGVVYEGFHLSGLPNYSTGGTIHVVVNNQIGFTTDPEDGRSSRYCTDVAKTLDIPVLHCNGDDPEAVAQCFQLAVEWRTRYLQDCVIDITCYRKYGHNEIDQPAFTQPLMYAVIQEHQNVLERYTERLVAAGVVTADKAESMRAKVNASLEDSFGKRTSYQPQKSEWLESRWKGFHDPSYLAVPRDTNITDEVYDKVAAAITSLPEDFTVHKSLKTILKRKQESLINGTDIDWATAEALAFGSLLIEGNHVRLSGQDVQRGTFSHRHAVLTDQKTGKKYAPLQQLDGARETITFNNSPLDEYAVLGFEIGYASDSPHNLVLWEAQFGDFANTAQVMIDQFISSGEQKWQRQCGITLLLPHGYDGQGPEHSSARLERFLQMSDDDTESLPTRETADVPSNIIQTCNMQVCNISTPANYFHALRRQQHRSFRKPLVIMAPKFLLRWRECVSTREDFTKATRFQPLIGDPQVPPGKARKVLIGSGQVVYHLLEERAKGGHDDVAILRLEQIAPFPIWEVSDMLAEYGDAEVTWVQEEPKNAGAWNFVYFHLLKAFELAGSDQRAPHYVGRKTAAAPATGSFNQHQREMARYLKDAFA